jgi:hypothetical protein
MNKNNNSKKQRRERVEREVGRQGCGWCGVRNENRSGIVIIFVTLEESRTILVGCGVYV